MGHPAAGSRANRAEQPIRAAELVGRSVDRNRSRHRAATRARHAHRRARGAPRRARRGASADDSRTPTTSRSCTPPGARRTGTRRRSCSATTSPTGPRSTSIDPTKPEEVLEFYRANVGGRPAAGGSRQDGRGGDRQCRPEGARSVRDDVRGRAAVRRLARPAARASRRRSSTCSRAGTGGGSRTSPARQIPLLDASAARRQRRLAVPLGVRRRARTRGVRGAIGRGIRPAARRARRGEPRRDARPS